MSYLAQAHMTEDHHLISRIAACAAIRGVTEPRVWVVQRMWQFSAQPGWATAYADAIADDPVVESAAWSPHAGMDADVITDPMILAAVEAILAAETPTPDA